MAIVTISRGSGSGGQLLAQRLAGTLGYGLVSREDVTQQAAEYGVPEEKLKEALVKAPGFWDRFKHERKRYLAFVQVGLCERVVGDDVVYHGNAGHLLLQGVSHVMCVRLIAPMSMRIRTVMDREHCSREEAIRFIENVDHERKNWTRFLYGVDWLDSGLYDLTINLRTMDIDGAMNVGVAATRSKAFETTPESSRAMQDLVLASHVRAALAANDQTVSVEVDVQASSGVVYLKGRIRDAPLVASVVEVAQGVAGVQRVDREDLDAPNVLV